MTRQHKGALIALGGGGGLWAGGGAGGGGRDCWVGVRSSRCWCLLLSCTCRRKTQVCIKALLRLC
jgi:hypothetical protein